MRAGPKPIIVASLMRSGTHVLIDMILNNFQVYKSNPLYLDLDKYLSEGHSLSDLKHLNAIVIKTHYPQVELKAADSEQVSDLLQRACILMPERSEESVYKSLSQFGEWSREPYAKFKAKAAAFNNFWGSFDVLRVPFEAMLSEVDGELCVQSIASHIEQECPAKMILPIKKHKVNKVLCTKLCTRLLGSKAPIINTTVGFGRTT